MPKRPQQTLVPRRGQQVDVVRLHVDRHVPGRLRGIDDERNTVLAGDRADRADRLNRAGHVRGMRHGDQPRVRTDGPADVLRIDQPALRIDRNARLLHQPLVLQRVQRPENRVVIDRRADAVRLQC